MNKDNKILFGICLGIIFMISVTSSYAYFNTAIINDNVKDQIVQTGTLSLRYVDGDEINMQNIKPGSTITKTVYVANTGTLDAKYNLVWQELVNEIINDEMVIEAKCTRMDAITESESGSCNSIATKPIKDENIKKNITIEPSIVHKYDITITFKETNEAQNYNQGKKFSGVLGVTEFKLPAPVYCTFDGEMVQGAEYTNGQYTYSYMQEGYHNPNDRGAFGWKNIDLDGWGARVNVSSGDVTSKLCTYINGKPVVSTSLMMYGQNNISSIDLSTSNTSTIIHMDSMFEEHGGLDDIDLENINFGNFDTSNVTNMSGMFYNSELSNLDLSSFDTSNVTNMRGMFEKSKITTLDLSNFDTSKVTNMSRMFYEIQATTLDVSNFDTSKVTDMDSMFYGSSATTLDISSFDTSNVRNMSRMFTNSKATTITGLNKFNTSNVTDMNDMFRNTLLTEIDLSSFDTSNVTDMSWMFSASAATTLDLSSFNTSNVTDMRQMFYNSTNLKTIYASDMFNTNSATSSSDMFYNTTNLVGGSGTTYNSSYIDKTYARIDGGTSLPGYFTLKNN